MNVSLLALDLQATATDLLCQLLGNHRIVRDEQRVRAGTRNVGQRGVCYGHSIIRATRVSTPSGAATIVN